MKKILCMTLALLLCFGLTVTAYAIPQADPSEKLYDYADLIDAADEPWLSDALKQLSETSGMDVAAVIIDDNEGYSSDVYADDFYDYNGFSDDGILMLINMDDREVYLTTCGEAIRYFTDGIIDEMTYELVDPLADGDYAGAVTMFVMLAEQVLQAPPQGESSSVSTTPPPIYDAPVEQRGTAWSQLLGTAAMIAAAFGGIVVAVMALLHNKLPSKAEATFHYVAGGDIRLTKNRDIFLTSNIRKTKIQQDSGTRSGGGGGRSHSHSTIHRASSGRMHGGGGRKF